MVPLLLVGVTLIHSAVGIPVPQLTEQQFRARARSLDNEIPHNVLMISGYSQVRRQGGRAFEDPIKFPTLTVKSPTQLYLDTPSKVKVSVADPVYNEKEIETIAQKLEEINQLEGERIKAEKEAEKEVEDVVEVDVAPLEDNGIEQEDEAEAVPVEVEDVPVEVDEVPVDEDEVPAEEDEAPVEDDEVPVEDVVEAVNENPEVFSVAVEELDADQSDQPTLQSFELNDYEEQTTEDSAIDLEEQEQEGQDYVQEYDNAPINSYDEQEQFVEDEVVEDDGLVVEEEEPVVQDVQDVQEEEPVEGSGASSLVEDMSLDVSEAEEFIIEEVTSTLPPIDFGDIQEI